VEKKDIYDFTRKAYSRLKDPDFALCFARLRGVHGYCFVGGGFIQINPRGEVLSTLVHELLHSMHPDWSETKVLRSESAIMSALSHRQMINLMFAMCEALKRSH